MLLQFLPKLPVTPLTTGVLMSMICTLSLSTLVVKIKL